LSLPAVFTQDAEALLPDVIVLTPDLTSDFAKYFDWWIELPRGAQEHSIGKWCSGDCATHPIWEK
jgi:hypothetical protein